MQFSPPLQLPVELDLQSDWRVYGFLFGLSLLTSVVFGLAPALATSRPELVGALKDEANTGGRQGRLRGALVIVQVAVSVLLLIGAGLFLRSLQNTRSIDPGFDADNLLLMSMDLQQQGYDRRGGEEFTAQLLNRTRALPGVVAASMADALPLSLGIGRRVITIEGYNPQPGEDTETHSTTVSPGYFETMRIPLLQGRTFRAQDHPNAPGVIVVNEAFARHYWPGQTPLGKRIQRLQMGGGNKAPHLTVIGVVKDGKYNTLGEEALPFFYLNQAQEYVATPTLIVRTQGNPATALALVRREIEALDKVLPLYDVKTMRQNMELALLPARLAGGVLGTFGLLALMLANAGIYGVMAHAVLQRTREIGIRMALGATARDVLQLVIRQGMQLVWLGMAIGIVAALALTQLLKGFLFGVSTTDPLTFFGIVVLLSFMALLACWIPARRVTKVHPMEALRYE